jgi:hypothetical protein
MIIAPNSDPASRNVVAEAAPKAGTLNSFTSISGRGARAACITKAAIRIRPATIGPHAIGSPMPPCVSVSESPKTTPARPGERSSSPSQSSLPASARPASACSSFAASASDTIAIGTLT